MQPSSLWRAALATILTVLLGACGATTVQPAMLTLPDGFRAERYAAGLRSPTALAWGPDGALWAAQLSGGENAGAGEIVRIGAAGAAPEPMLNGLFKPTGLAWRGNDLYIAAGRDVLRARLNAAGTISEPERIVAELGSNGRSEGQMALLSDGRVLFEASGSIGDANSGKLFALDEAAQIETIATGLKNAYAYAIDPATHTIFATEIGDDRMDGRAPPEEINVVRAGRDYGWPRCYADQQPATSRGGTTADCVRTEPPLITLPPHTTPTGLAFYEHDDFPNPYRNSLFVALWNGDPPQVLHVALDRSGARLRGTATPFASGLGQPIDLLAHPDGGLLVLDFQSGAIVRIVAA